MGAVKNAAFSIKPGRGKTCAISPSFINFAFEAFHATEVCPAYGRMCAVLSFPSLLHMNDNIFHYLPSEGGSPAL